MPLSEQDVRRALDELGRMRFGVADVNEAMHDIVRTTHSIFGVDGAALMLVDSEHHLRVAAVSDPVSPTSKHCSSSTTRGRAWTPSSTIG